MRSCARFLSSKHGVPTLANEGRKSRWNKAMREYEEVYMPPVKAVYDAGPRNSFGAAASSMSTATATGRAYRSCSISTPNNSSARGAAAAVPYVPDLSGLYPVELQVRIAQMLSTVGLLSGAEVYAASAATPKIYVCMHCRQCTKASCVAFVRRRSSLQMLL